ncbi:MAG: hypothetical protein QME92_05790 [Bacillota bacterium]|nr:hypothetical protein [Bacillota bacterium]
MAPLGYSNQHIIALGSRPEPPTPMAVRHEPSPSFYMINEELVVTPDTAHFLWGDIVTTHRL